ncbi:MAG: hypothetical protein LBI38_05280 [Oscillospiraceae bacterium]|nr:hypothetical protein [Oscillospiraceae bacterium]
MNRKILKRVAVVVYGSFVFSILSTVSFAGTAYSPWKAYHEYGYNYRNRSVIYTGGYNEYRVEALTSVGSSGQTVPTGYMKAEAVMYNSDAWDVIMRSAWVVNTAPVAPDVSLVAITTKVYDVRPTNMFSSEGRTQAYNPGISGNYSLHYAYGSPDQSF